MCVCVCVCLCVSECVGVTVSFLVTCSILAVIGFCILIGLIVACQSQVNLDTLSNQILLHKVVLPNMIC